MVKNRLKEIRMGEYMMSKRDFASYLKIIEQQYLRYENDISNPSLEIAFKIAKVLNKHLDDIWYIEN